MTPARARLDLRIAADARRIERARLARRAIGRGLQDDLVREIFELSPTAYQQLAGHERMARAPSERIPAC